MYGESFLNLLFFLRLDRVAHGGPSGVQHIDRAEAIENSIAAKYDEIVYILVYCELGDFGLSNHYSFLASEFLELRFNISESASDTESSRQYSVRTVEHLLLLASDLAVLVRDWYRLVSLSLIHLASVVLDPVELGLFVGSMIL